MICSDCIFWQLTILVLPALALLLIARFYVFRMGYTWNQRSLAFLNLPVKPDDVLYVGKVSNSLIVNAFIFVCVGLFLWCSVSLRAVDIVYVTTLLISLIIYSCAYLLVAAYVFSCVIVLRDVVYIRAGLASFSKVILNINDILSCEFYVNRLYNTVMILKIETLYRNYVVTNILDGEIFVNIVNKFQDNCKIVPRSG